LQTTLFIFANDFLQAVKAERTQEEEKTLSVIAGLNFLSEMTHIRSKITRIARKMKEMESDSIMQIKP
jgi:cell division protein ZapA (FtsZ GTPase activity inhibitor)